MGGTQEGGEERTDRAAGVRVGKRLPAAVASLAFLERWLTATPIHLAAAQRYPFERYEHPHLFRPDGSDTNW